MAEIAQIAPIEGDFTGKHITSMYQFEAPDVLDLIGEAGLMQQALAKHRHAPLLPGHVLVAMMAQDSSRTGGSFATAMDKLGGRGRVPDLGQSSMNKGEDFFDTATCFATQADALVIRTPEDGGIERTIENLQQHQQLILERDEELWDVRVINAGDGTNEHPSQANLDLFSFHKWFGGLDGLEITLVGPLAPYRATNSLAVGASLFDTKVNLVMPDFSPMQEKFIETLKARGSFGEVSDDVRPFLRQSDVVYVARAATEYAKTDAQKRQMRAFLDKNTMTPALMAEMNPNGILGHALPRNDEIRRDCDALRNSYYVAQMRNGVPARMGLLAKMFGVSAATLLEVEKLPAALAV